MTELERALEWCQLNRVTARFDGSGVTAWSANGGSSERRTTFLETVRAIGFEEFEREEDEDP